MFILRAEKNKLTVVQREQITSGSVNVYPVKFEFSQDWDDLTQTAVFRNSHGEPRAVLLDDANQCSIPWEVLTLPKSELCAGVYGTRGGDIVLPTIWASLGTIQEGVTAGENARPPTPGPYEQILGELEDIRETVEGLVVTGGTTDHRQLRHRDDEDQHPVGAITGLPDALARIPRPMTADELRKILLN